MPGHPRKKNLVDAIEIARQRFFANEVFQRMSELEKKELTFGGTVRHAQALCRAYIPGLRPQDARQLAHYVVDLETGAISEIDYAEFSRRFEAL